MSSPSRIHIASATLALFTLGGLLGCTEKTPCSDGERFDNGYCYPVDAAAPRADAAACLAIDAGSSGFGQACTDSTQCVSPTYYCAIQPPNTTGFCSAFGCDTDPCLCPTSWTCMDLTPYGMAAHLCTPPQ